MYEESYIVLNVWSEKGMDVLIHSINNYIANSNGGIIFTYKKVPIQENKLIVTFESESKMILEVAVEWFKKRCRTVGIDIVITGRNFDKIPWFVNAEQTRIGG